MYNDVKCLLQVVVMSCESNCELCSPFNHHTHYPPKMHLPRFPFCHLLSFAALLCDLAHKYKFLYSPDSYLNASLGMRALEQQVYVIHKVEAISKHNYPAVNMSDLQQSYSGFAGNQTGLTSSTPVRVEASLTRRDSSLTGNQSLDSTSQVPYRTISHFGFNCPLITAPSIPLHPEHRSIWQAVAEQREKVVSFIDLTTLSLDNRKLLNVVTNQTQGHGQAQAQSQSFVSEKHIQLEVTPQKRKQRVYSTTTTTSSGRSADDSMDELESMLSGLTIRTPRRHEQQDSGLYRSYTFLPSNHVLPGSGTDATASGQADRDRERPEAEQGEMFLRSGGTDDSGLGTSSGRRQRLVTTSNESSTQEAEAYTQGKHVRLTLSSSPTPAAGGAGQQPTTIEILINVSLRNAECIETVQTHEQEFRAKLEKVIDEEIHYISQQLAYQQRQTELHQQVQQAKNRAPLASPTSSLTPQSSLLQRCNSAPALCHTYSYVAVALAESDMPPPPPPKLVEESSPSLAVDRENLNGLLVSLEKELERLLNSVVKAHMMHNKAIIHDCRARILQITEGLATS